MLSQQGPAAQAVWKRSLWPPPVRAHGGSVQGPWEPPVRSPSQMNSPDWLLTVAGIEDEKSENVGWVFPGVNPKVSE